MTCAPSRGGPLRGRPGSRIRRLLAAIAAVIIVSVGVGVVVAQLIGGAREGLRTAAASSEPSVTPTTTVEPTATETQKAQTPTPSPSRTAAAVGILANGAIANVSVDALNLRDSADASSASLATLPEGTELYVIGQPQDDGDLRWYRVGVAPDADELCTDLCEHTVGWVATPATGEDRWIEEVEVACPASPVTVDQLTAMTALSRLHCFGGADFTGTGWADNHCCGYVGGIVFEPAWLAWPPFRFFRASDFYTTLYYQPAPETYEGSTSGLPVAGDIVQFTGHFDDPAAPDCHAEFSDDAETTGLTLPDTADVVFGCRLRLVITDFEVTGHEGEGTCGCLTPPSPSPGTGSAERNADF
jgi:hypothetical protein